MGKTISIWAVCITLLLAGFSYTVPLGSDLSEDLTIVNSSELKINVDSDEDFKFFLRGEYEESLQEIKFLTREKTNQIRIYSGLGDMIYLLPIGSDRVSIGKSLFESGDYKFVFDIAGDRKMYTSKLTVY